MKKMLVIAIAVVLLNLVPMASVQAQEDELNCPSPGTELQIFLASKTVGELIANWKWDGECLLQAGERTEWYMGNLVIGKNYPDNQIFVTIIAAPVFSSTSLAWIDDDPYGAQCPEDAWFCLLIAADY